jgi:hypothetical protein
MFPVRYELNIYVIFTRNIVFEGPIHDQCLQNFVSASFPLLSSPSALLNSKDVTCVTVSAVFVVLTKTPGVSETLSRKW